MKSKIIRRIRSLAKVPSITAINRRKQVQDLIMSISEPQLNVLDIGSGYRDWSHLFDSSSKYETVDIRHDSGATYIGDFNAFDFPRKYNLVIATELLEHLPNPKQFFIKCNELLTNDGKVLVSFPFLFKIHADPDDFFRYTPQGIKALSEEFFSIESVYSHGNRLQLVWEILVDNKWLFPIKFINYLIARLDFKSKNFPLGFVILLKKNS